MLWRLPRKSHCGIAHCSAVREAPQFFSGTNKSWALHLETYSELKETFEVDDSVSLLKVLQWTLSDGAKNTWHAYQTIHNANTDEFKILIDEKYSSEMPYTLKSHALHNVSLYAELRSKENGDSLTRNSRVMTRIEEKIHYLTKDLHI